LGVTIHSLDDSIDPIFGGCSVVGSIQLQFDPKETILRIQRTTSVYYFQPIPFDCFA